MGMDDENTGRRHSRRRSSILKLPLSTIDVNKQVEEKPDTNSRHSSKRVSFANYTEIKEFHEVSLTDNNNSGNKQTPENWNKEPDSNKISEIQSLLTGEIKNTAHAVENISDAESEEEIGISVDPLNRSILVTAEKVCATTCRSITIPQTIEDKENINVCAINSEVRNSLPPAMHNVNNSDEKAQDTSFLEKVMADIPLSSTSSSQKNLLFTNDFNCPASVSTKLFLHNYINTHAKDDDNIQTSDELKENNSSLDSPQLNKSMYQGNHTVYFDRNDSMDLTKTLGKHFPICNESEEVVTNSPDGHMVGYYNPDSSYEEKTIYFNRSHHAASNMDLTCCNTITFSNFRENGKPIEITKVRDVENIQNFCENKQFNKDESSCKLAKELTTNSLKLPADNCMPSSSNKCIGQHSNLASKNIIDKENIPCELNEIQSVNFRANSNPKDNLGSMIDFGPSITDVSNTRTERTVLDDQKEHTKTGSKRTCFSETSEIPSKQSNTNDRIEPAIKKQNLSGFNEFASNLSGLICCDDNELNNSNELILKKSNFKNRAQPMTTSEEVPEKLVPTEPIKSHLVDSSGSCPQKILIDPSQLASKELSLIKSSKSILNSQDLSDATEFNKDDHFHKLAKGLTTNPSKLPADKRMLHSSNTPIDQPSNLPSKNIMDKENILGGLNKIGSVEIVESIEMGIPVNFRAKTIPKDNVGSMTDFRPSIVSNTRTERTVLNDQKEHTKTVSKRTCFSETSEIPSKQSNTDDIIEPVIKKQNLSGFNELVRKPKGQSLKFASNLSGLICRVPVFKKSNLKNSAQPMTTSEAVPEKLVPTEPIKSHLVDSSESCPQKILIDPSQLASKELSLTKSSKSILNSQDLSDATEFNKDDHFCKLAKELTANPSKLPADKRMLPSSNTPIDQPSNLPSKNIIDSENIPEELNKIGSVEIVESIEMGIPVNFRAKTIPKDNVGSMTDFGPSIVSNTRTERSVLDDQKEHTKTGSKRTCFSETSEIPSKQSNTNDRIEPAIMKQNLSGFNEFASNRSGLICCDDNELNNTSEPVLKKSNFKSRAQPMITSEVVPEKLVFTEPIKSHLVDSSESCPKKILVDPPQLASKELSQTKSSKSILNSQDLSDATELNKDDNFSKLAEGLTINPSKLPAYKYMLPSSKTPIDEPSNLPSNNIMDKENKHTKTESKKTCFSETSEIPSKQSNTDDIIEPVIKKQNLSGFNELVRKPKGQSLEFASNLSGLICHVPVLKKSNLKNPAQPMTTCEAVPEKLVLTEPIKSHLVNSSGSCPKKILVDPSQSASKELSLTKSNKSILNSQDLLDATDFNKDDNLNKLAKELTANPSKLPADNCMLPSSNKPIDQLSNLALKNIIDKKNIPGEINKIGSEPAPPKLILVDQSRSTTKVSNLSESIGSTSKPLSILSNDRLFLKNNLPNITELVSPLSQIGKLTGLSDTNSSQNKTSHIKAVEPPIKNVNISESQMTASCLSHPLDQSPTHDSGSNKNLKDSDTNLNGTYANEVNILKTKTREKAVGFPELTENNVSSSNNNNFELSHSFGNWGEDKLHIKKHSSVEVTNEKEKKNKDEILAEKMQNVMPSQKKHVLYLSANTSGINVENSASSAPHSEGLHLTEKDSVKTKESMPLFSSSVSGKCKENLVHLDKEIMPPSVQVPYETNCSNIEVYEQSAIRGDADQTSASCNKVDKLSENNIQDNKTQTEKPKLIRTNNNLTKLQNRLFNIGNVIENVRKGEVKKDYCFDDCVLKVNNTDVPDKYHHSQISSLNNLKKSNDSSFNTSNIFSRRQTCSETISSKLHESSLNSSLFTTNKGSLMFEKCIQPNNAVAKESVITDTSDTQHNDVNTVSEKIDDGFDFNNADVSDIMDEKPDILVESFSHEENLNLSPEKIEPQSYSQQPSRSASLMTDRSILDIKNSISTLNSISESRLCSRLLMNMQIPSMERPLSLMEVETIEDLLFLVGVDRLKNVALACRHSNVYATSMVLEAQSIEEKMEIACILYPKYQSMLKSYELLKSDEERLMKEFRDPELLYGFRNVLEEREKTTTKGDIKKQLLADFKICKQITENKMEHKKAKYLSDLSSAFTDKLIQMEKANSQIEDITSKLDQQIDNLDKVLKDFDEKIELLNSKSEYSESQIKHYTEGRTYLDEADSIKQEQSVLSMKYTQLDADKTKLVETCTKLENTLHQLQKGKTPEQLSLENKYIELKFYSILSPWKIWELQNNVIKFTFWMDTLQLSLHTDSLQNITEINFVIDEVWESVAEDHPWLCLAHNMRKATINEKEIFKDCTNISQFSQLLCVFSAEMMKLQDLAREIYSLSVKHHLKLQNNCITVTYCCLKSMSKVMVDFYVDAVQYPLSIMKFEIKYQYGQISCEDITRRLRRVQPGLRYFSRLVTAVDLELAASKF